MNMEEGREKIEKEVEEFRKMEIIAYQLNEVTHINAFGFM
jgi:hypothetical protein